MESSLSAPNPPPIPPSVYLALRANDQARRFINIHLHYMIVLRPLTLLHFGSFKTISSLHMVTVEVMKLLCIHTIVVVMRLSHLPLHVWQL